MSDEIVKHRVSVVSRAPDTPARTPVIIALKRSLSNRLRTILYSLTQILCKPTTRTGTSAGEYCTEEVDGTARTYPSLEWSAHLTDGQTDRHSHTARVRRPGSGPHAGGHCRVVTAPALLTDKMRFAVGSLVGKYGQLLLSTLPLTSRCTLNGWWMGGGGWLARMNLATLPPTAFPEATVFLQRFFKFSLTICIWDCSTFQTTLRL